MEAKKLFKAWVQSIRNWIAVQYQRADFQAKFVRFFPKVGNSIQKGAKSFGGRCRQAWQGLFLLAKRIDRQGKVAGFYRRTKTGAKIKRRTIAFVAVCLMCLALGFLIIHLRDDNAVQTTSSALKQAETLKVEADQQAIAPAEEIAKTGFSWRKHVKLFFLFGLPIIGFIVLKIVGRIQGWIKTLNKKKEEGKLPNLKKITVSTWFNWGFRLWLGVAFVFGLRWLYSRLAGWSSTGAIIAVICLILFILPRLFRFSLTKLLNPHQWVIFFLIKLPIALAITLFIYAKRSGGFNYFLDGFRGVAWQLQVGYLFWVAALLGLTLFLIQHFIWGYKEKGFMMKIVRIGGTGLLYVLIVRFGWGVSATSNDYPSYLKTPAFVVYNVDFPLPESRFCEPAIAVPPSQDGKLPRTIPVIEAGEVLAITVEGGLMLPENMIAEAYLRAHKKPVDRVTPEVEPLYVSQMGGTDSKAFPCPNGQYAGVVVSLRAANGRVYQYVPITPGKKVVYLEAVYSGTLVATYNLPLDVPYYVNMVIKGGGNFTTKMWMCRVPRDKLPFLSEPPQTALKK